MGDRNRNHDSAFKPRKRIFVREEQTIKRSCRKSLKSDPATNTAKFAKLIDEYVMETTRCYILGALNLHCFTSYHFQTDTDEQIESFYSQFVDTNFFLDWFRGMKFVESERDDVKKCGYRVSYGIWYYCGGGNVRYGLDGAGYDRLNCYPHMILWQCSKLMNQKQF